MSEPLLGRQVLVAHCDTIARLATVRAELAGPAGTAGLDLGAGLELDVDVAHPASLAELSVALPPAGQRGGRLPLALRRRLTALLGRDRADALQSVLRDGPGDRHAQAQVLGPDGSDGSEALQWGGLADAQPAAKRAHSGGRNGAARVGQHIVASNGRSPAVPSGVAPALHRAAMAHANACQVDASLPVQALGLLEAAMALDQLDHLFDASRVAHENARVGTDLLLRSADAGLLTVPDQATARSVASTVRSVSHMLTDARSMLPDVLALADALDEGAHVTCPRRWATQAADLVPSRGSSPRSADARVAVDLWSLPGALIDAAVSARRVGPSEVEVRIEGWADRRHGLWARAFDASDDVIRALASFRADGRDAVACLFVSPDAISRIEVDVTDRPALPRPSPVLAVLQRAIHLGFVAARCERVGDRRQAVHRWGQCAQAWDTTGDTIRADQARTYAEQAASVADGAAGRLIAPLVSDLISHPLASRADGG